MATIEVPLSRGLVALIDEEDAGAITCCAWHAVDCGCAWYAARTKRISPAKSIRIYMHRLICACPKGLLVDHINRNTLDNRRANLRVTDKQTNAVNSKKRRGTYSRYRGVTWCRRDKRWMASIRDGERSLHLGNYMTAEDAARAYNAAAIEVYGEVANLNEIPGVSYEESLVAPVRNRNRGRASGAPRAAVGPRAASIA